MVPDVRQINVLCVINVYTTDRYHGTCFSTVKIRTAFVGDSNLSFSFLAHEIECIKKSFNAMPEFRQ